MIIAFTYLILIFVWFKSEKKPIRYGVFISAVCIATLWRLSSWLEPYCLNSDEAEWLVLAHRSESCSIPFRCFNSSTSGFLNILILKILPILGLKWTYMNLRIFGFIAFVLPSGIFIMRGLQIYYGRVICNYLFPWISLLLIFCFYDREFLAYNTEYPLLLFYSIVYYLYAFIRTKNFIEYKLILLLSLILGFLPYIKLQSVPFVFAWYMILLFVLLRNKQTREIIFLHLGLILPSFIFFIYFLSIGILNDFYRMYIESNAYYVTHRITTYKFGNTEFIHRLRTFKNLHLWTFKSVYIGLIPVFLYMISKLYKNIIKDIKVDWGMLWVFVCVSYSTYTTGNGFGHYNILLLAPLLYVIGNVYSNVHQYNKNILKICTLLGVLYPLLIYNTRSERSKYIVDRYLTSTEKYIVNNTNKDEFVYFLGWKEALESQLITERRLPGRNATFQYIGIKDFALRQYYQSGWFYDMEKHNPPIIIDMVKVLNMKGLDPLKKYVIKNYYIDTVIDGNIVYHCKKN